VLNAFRHHRNSHTLNGIQWDGGSRAQRLSASSEFSLAWMDFRNGVWECSTPFGIIGILTPTRVRVRWAMQSAQRLSASSEFSLAAPQRPLKVGLRAQRLSASSEFSPIVFGEIPALKECAQRLSASSEFSPIDTRVIGSRPLGCSTPFGIIGILTRRTMRLFPAPSGAQRLSASSEFSRDCGAWVEMLSRVLNAFRHHRNSHKLGIDDGDTTKVCAQRLSASSEFSLPPRGRL